MFLKFLKILKNQIPQNLCRKKEHSLILNYISEGDLRNLAIITTQKQGEVRQIWEDVSSTQSSTPTHCLFPIHHLGKQPCLYVIFLVLISTDAQSSSFLKSCTILLCPLGCKQNIMPLRQEVNGMLLRVIRIKSFSEY